MTSKSDVSIASGICDMCKSSTYNFVAGSMDKALQALKAMGWISATKDGETKQGCPKDACHSDMRAWWGGFEQGKLDIEAPTDDEQADAEGV